ncbi:Hypothetical predicted protein [Olea europaea subsp. europaea]|uniref:Uncharacterized protein n=1 Tax=Olea europaea subsp. europaea TaxID=158383 RepID=A0A8S0Q3R0_OLEEU|nr:Hypothetical predicted protein [Olea europaea subsp. europaea]
MHYSTGRDYVFPLIDAGQSSALVHHRGFLGGSSVSPSSFRVRPRRTTKKKSSSSPSEGPNPRVQKQKIDLQERRKGLKTKLVRKTLRSVYSSSSRVRALKVRMKPNLFARRASFRQEYGIGTQSFPNSIMPRSTALGQLVEDTIF